MANKKLLFQGTDGRIVEIEAIEQPDGTYRLGISLAGGDIQIGAVEIKDGTTDTRAPVGVKGLYIDPQQSSTEVLVSVAMTTHAAYVAGDFVGTNATPLTLANCARVNGGTGTILGAVLIDKAGQSVACELWLFRETVTPPNDSAAWSISDADAEKCIGVIPFTTYFASALNSISNGEKTGIGFKAAPASKDLFGCIVTRGAPTYNSGDLSVYLLIWQD